MPTTDTASNQVYHPQHYQISSSDGSNHVEVLDVIRESLTDEEFAGFLKGNVIKYMTRSRRKNGEEDLEKAQYYLDYYLCTFRKAVDSLKKS